MYSKITLTFFLVAIAFWLKGQPVANFSANKLSGCSPLTVQFSDLSTGNPNTFYWRFGNGNTSILQNPFATYVNPGTYTVTLIATSSSGTDSITRLAYIKVFANPTANFTQNVTSGCAPLPVQFTNTSTVGSAPINSYIWDFGDGNLSTQQSPAHTYGTSGTRTVTLAVTDTNGCQHAVTKPNIITVNQTQTINFSANNTGSCSAPLTSNFTSTVTPAGAYTYLWTTSNGLTSTQQHPQFIFNTSGKFSVTLKVTNGTGCAEQITKLNYINITGVSANFIANPINSCVGDSTYFTNTSLPDTNIAAYVWRLNGNITSTAKHYAVPPLPLGNHTISLAIDALSCSANTSKTITVHSKPLVDFVAAPTSICFVPVKVRFTNLSQSGSGFQYKWSFGNDSVSNKYHDSTTYLNLVNHDVKLTVTNAVGCKDSLIKQIQPQQPTVKIDKQNEKAGCIPYNAFFTLLPGQASQFTSFSWKYKNNVISTDSAFSYSFTDTGKHVVTLRLVSTTGCMVELTDTVLSGIKIPVTFTAPKIDSCYGYYHGLNFNGVEHSGIPNVLFKWLWAGGSSEGKNTLAIFNDTGVFNVTFMANHNGCISDSTSFGLVRLTAAMARFMEPTVNCANDSMIFNNKSIGKNRIKWFFGDGDSSTLQQPKHLYHTSGLFQVKLVALDTVLNCPDTFTMDVFIPNAPQLKWHISDTMGCPPLRVTFTNQTTTGNNGINIVSTQWDINGKLINDSLIHKDTFNFPQVVNVKLRIKDSRNCNYMLQKDTAVWVSGGIAKIGLSAENGCAPFTFTAIDSSQIDMPIKNRKWTWTPTDSNITTAKTINHTYNLPSVVQSTGYNITLLVTDIAGCKFSTIRKVVPSKPNTNIALERYLTCGLQTLHLTAPTSITQVYAPAKYTWLVGAFTDTNAICNKPFAQIDTTINVSLSITDFNGCAVTKDTTLQIKNKPPQVGFYAATRKLACYKPILPLKLFDTTTVGSTPIVNWNWTTAFNTSNLKNPELLFPEPGKYGISLKIIDSAGCVDSISQPNYFDIGGPSGTYTFSPKKGCMPHTVKFKVSSPNALLFKWDLADGSIDTAETDSYEYQYPNPGIYFPTLTLIDSSSTCESVIKNTDTIIVYELPKPTFIASDALVCINSDIIFANTTPQASLVNQWLWKINDKDSSTQLGPISLNFTKPGLYKVTLVAKNNNNCYDSLVKPAYITVSDDTIPPPIPIGYNASVVDNNTNVFYFSKSVSPDFLRYKVYYNYISGAASNSSYLIQVEDTIFVQTSINALTNSYSYSVAAIDACDNLSDTGKVHTTINLTAASTTNAINLNWSAYVGFDSIAAYEIWRNNPDSGNNYVLVNRVNSVSYTDSFITCFTSYFYKIKAVEFAGNNRLSWSDTAGAVPIYTTALPSTSILRVTVIDNKSTLLQWQQQTHKLGFNYVVMRMRNDENDFAIVAQLTDTFFEDLLVDIEKYNYTYKVVLKDACGGMGQESNTAKTILLTASLQPDNMMRFYPYIKFNKYTYWQNGVNSYQLNFYDEATETFLPLQLLSATDTFYTHNQANSTLSRYCYSVIAMEQSGNQQQSQSNIACIDIKPNLYVPNVFTVNGDGINDKFFARGLFVDEFEMIIIDRWGRVVFTATNLNQGWDGTIDGKPAPADVYTYVAKGKDFKQKEIKQSGTITLLR